MLRYVIKIDNKKLILSNEQLEDFIAIVSKCEYIENTYRKNEEGKYAYEDELHEWAADTMPITVLTENAYNALKFFTEVAKSRKE